MSLVRALQFCLTVYVVLAILHTTSCIFFLGLRYCISEATLSFSLFRSHHGLPVPPANINHVWLDRFSDPLNRAMCNPSHESSPCSETFSQSILSEDTFISKAFSHSMRPSKIIPYYYRANGKFDPDDITITTLVTSNRFSVFAQLVERYQGLVSRCRHLTCLELITLWVSRAYIRHRSRHQRHIARSGCARLAPRAVHLLTRHVPLRRRASGHRRL